MGTHQYGFYFLKDVNRYTKSGQKAEEQERVMENKEEKIKCIFDMISLGQ